MRESGDATARTAAKGVKPGADPMPVLSVVIIARNEEVHVAGCIESALATAADFAGCEVTLVDSRSTDRTIEIARRYPVDIVRLRDGVRCTAALGRLVGERLTRGRYLLFVDGDTMISAEWATAAVRLLDAEPTVAGVGGKLHEVYYRDGVRVAEREDFFAMGDASEEAYQLGGNAIYRRAALDRAGTFNPAVISHEEAEVAERLRAAGYRLLRIPLRVGSHHTAVRDAAGECWRRFGAGLMVGYGQVLRLSIGTPSFWVHARHMNRYLLTLGFLLAGAGCMLAMAVTGRASYVVAWCAAAGTLMAGFAVRSRGIRRPAVVLLDWVLTAAGIVWGFVIAPTAPTRPDVEQLADRIADGGATAGGAAGHV